MYINESGYFFLFPSDIMIKRTVFILLSEFYYYCNTYFGGINVGATRAIILD